MSRKKYKKIKKNFFLLIFFSFPRREYLYRFIGWLFFFDSFYFFLTSQKAA